MTTITKVSDITYTDVGEYMRLTDDMLADQDEINYITSTISVAKTYISKYTGIPEDELDNYGDLPIVVLALCQDMYDNRTMYVDKANVNETVATILGMYRINLL